MSTLFRDFRAFPPFLQFFFPHKPKIEGEMSSGHFSSVSQGNPDVFFESFVAKLPKFYNLDKYGNFGPFFRISPQFLLGNNSNSEIFPNTVFALILPNSPKFKQIFRRDHFYLYQKVSNSLPKTGTQDYKFFWFYIWRPLLGAYWHFLRGRVLQTPRPPGYIWGWGLTDL